MRECDNCNRSGCSKCFPTIGNAQKSKAKMAAVSTLKDNQKGSDLSQLSRQYSEFTVEIGVSLRQGHSDYELVGLVRCHRESKLIKVRERINEQIPDIPEDFVFMRKIQNRFVKLSSAHEISKHALKAKHFCTPATESNMMYLFVEPKITYYAGERLSFDETKTTEFKSLEMYIKYHGSPLKLVKQKVAKYINSFLNSAGGVLYFGINDEGIVEEVEIKVEERDMMRKHIDECVRNMEPAVDDDLVYCSFVPVRPKHDTSDESTILNDNFVFEVHVRKGNRAVYFMGNSTWDAYHRREGSTHYLTKDLIRERHLHSNRGSPVKGWRDIEEKLDFTNFITEKTNTFVGREWLFETIDSLSHNLSTKAICITGAMGSGKSSILASLMGKMEYFRRTKVLGYHFCRAENPETQSPPRFVMNVAAHAIEKLGFYRHHLSQTTNGALGALNRDRCESKPDSAFSFGILEPLRGNLKFGKRTSATTYLLIVDSLEESIRNSNMDSNNGRRSSRNIAELLLHNLKSFPPWLILVFSVRKSQFRHNETLLALKNTRGVKMIDLDEEKQSYLDIQKYVHLRIQSESKLAVPVQRASNNKKGKIDVANDNTIVDTATANDDNDLEEQRQELDLYIDLLTKRCDANYLYVKGVLDQILVGSLSWDLVHKLPPGVDRYYSNFFERQFGHNENKYHYLRIAFQILLAYARPMPFSKLLSIVRIEDPDASKELILPTLHMMEPVFDVFTHNNDDEISFMISHESFRLWLEDPNQSGPFYVSKQKGHALISANLLLKHMPVCSKIKKWVFSGTEPIRVTMENIFEIAIHLEASQSESVETRAELLSGCQDLLNLKGGREQESALHLACTQERIGVVELLLLAKADKEIQRTYDHSRPLHLASLKGNKPLVEMLLSFGCNHLALTKDGRTCLFNAATQGHEELVVLFLKILKEKNFPQELFLKILNGAESSKFRTALWYCAAEGQRLCIIHLLSAGADPTLFDIKSRTPLFITCSHGHDGCLTTLLDNPLGLLSINYPDFTGRTCLHQAIRHAKLTCAKILISRGADINYRTHTLQFTPIHEMMYVHPGVDSLSEAKQEMIIKQRSFHDLNSSSSGSVFEEKDFQTEDEVLDETVLQDDNDDNDDDDDDDDDDLPLLLKQNLSPEALIEDPISEEQMKIKSERDSPKERENDDHLEVASSSEGLNGLSPTTTRNLKINRHILQQNKSVLNLSNEEASTAVFDYSRKPSRILSRPMMSEVLQCLMDSPFFKLDLELEDIYRRTPLVLAIQANDLFCVELLLKHGCRSVNLSPFPKEGAAAATSGDGKKWRKNSYSRQAFRILEKLGVRISTINPNIILALNNAYEKQQADQSLMSRNQERKQERKQQQHQQQQPQQQHQQQQHQQQQLLSESRPSSYQDNHSIPLSDLGVDRRKSSNTSMEMPNHLATVLSSGDFYLEE